MTTRCERCRKPVDRETAYHQDETMSFGGRVVRVVAYYCAECRSMLSACGCGEHTDLQARRTARPDSTPYTKCD